MHDGRDVGWDTAVQPRRQGKAALMRSGDAFVSGCAREDAARRVVAVRDKRMARCGLALPPDHTRLWPVRGPPTSQPRGKGPAPVDFLGVTC